VIQIIKYDAVRN